MAFCTRSQRGLSLIEVGIVLALIAVLMAVSLPMLTRANAEARSVVCRENLTQIGEAFSGYIHDNRCLPTLRNQPDEPGDPLPGFIAPYVCTPSAAFCPSDETETSQQLGTSYHWATAMNNLAAADFDTALDRPLLADRQPFHDHAEVATNELRLRRAGDHYQFTVTGSDWTDGPSLQTSPPATDDLNDPARSTPPSR